MFADGLTKIDKKLCESFTALLQDPVLQLAEQVSKKNSTSDKFRA